MILKSVGLEKVEIVPRVIAVSSMVDILAQGSQRIYFIFAIELCYL